MPTPPVGIKITSFDGKWVSNTDGSIYVITGREVTCENTGGKACFSADGESLMGCRFSVIDSSNIVWSDGDRWSKLASSTSASLPPVGLPTTGAWTGGRSPQASEWPFGAVPGGPGHRILAQPSPSSPPQPPDLATRHHWVTPTRHDRQMSPPPGESPDREIAAAAVLASVQNPSQIGRYATALTYQTGTDLGSNRSSPVRMSARRHSANQFVSSDLNIPKPTIMSPVPRAQTPPRIPVTEVTLPPNVSPPQSNRSSELSDARILLQRLRLERQEAVDTIASQNIRISRIDDQINNLMFAL
eukprot:TRINITY_DN1578_c8_g1_i1.p1 TRINITY_DN1578_c8_g1~~TRINITY_DN1578_c8_g1_i1.p1  ORF type:complete len:301 (+),score=42.48 TRINITY_DN1578_c8_g1_i1:38-940(+)